MLIKVTSFVKKLNSRINFEKKVSRNKIYKMIEAGDIKANKLGSEYLINDSELDRLEKELNKTNL